MKRKNHLKILFFFTFLFMLSVTAQKTVGVLLNTKKALDGYTLFTAHKETYLINNKGEVVKQWTSKYPPAKSVYLLENGNLLRAAQLPDTGKFTMPSVGGRIELFDWDGNLIWGYNYSNAKATQHHDIYPMPNGNVLILAIEVMDRIEASKKGRKLITPPFFQLYNEQILELKPKGSNDADIVWKWNVKDHLIQNINPSFENYGKVNENLHRLDINYIGSSSGGANWIHLNSIQYNAELDQIVMSSKHLSEIYIIDHSTTTAEAAKSFGGKYNKGGDFLYRWGNPAVYGQGTKSDQKLFAPHYPHWIDKGLKNEGKIMIFNNGSNRSPKFSEVFIITPPTGKLGKYTLAANKTYGPNKPDYTYTAAVKTDFYSAFQSSAQVLSNGNILICEGANGRFFEIDSNKNIVWEYINPIGASKIITQGNNTKRKGNTVFRAKKYASNYKAFQGKNLKPGLTIEKQ